MTTVSDRDVRSAYENGFNAASSGIDIAENPHSDSLAGRMLWDAWRRGHADSAYEQSVGQPVAQ